MYVPFFRCESFPYISRRADWFPCALFPFHSPCTPLVFISVPFMSLSIPLCFPVISRCFPVMSTSYFLPSFPCTSLHFLAFPLCSPAFPVKNTVFPVFSQRGRPKTQSLSRFRQETQTGKEPAGGIEPGTPVMRRHQITARYVGDPLYPTYHVGRGGLGGGLSSILS